MGYEEFKEKYASARKKRKADYYTIYDKDILDKLLNSIDFTTKINTKLFTYRIPTIELETFKVWVKMIISPLLLADLKDIKVVRSYNDYSSLSVKFTAWPEDMVMCNEILKKVSMELRNFHRGNKGEINGNGKGKDTNI